MAVEGQVCVCTCGITKLNKKEPNTGNQFLAARFLTTIFFPKRPVVSAYFPEKKGRERNCGQKARRQQLITSAWLFVATLFNFDRKGHGEWDFVSHKFL